MCIRDRDNGVTVKWTINPNDNNNYQNKLDEALLKQDLSLIHIYDVFDIPLYPIPRTPSSSSCL